MWKYDCKNIIGPLVCVDLKEIYDDRQEIYTF